MSAGPRHPAPADPVERVVAALRAAGLDPERLDPDALAPIDELHTGGRRATVALARLAGVAAADRVLDVGAGLGGPARRLARSFGCEVTALDVAPELCRLCELLTAATGLAGRVHTRHADAVALPFEDASFDLVWTQHAGMAVADKPRLYAEARRVLAAGGRLALFDVLRGDEAGVRYPTPWATRAADSHLVDAGELAELLRVAGFRARVWDDLTDDARGWYAEGAARPAPPLGPSVLGDDWAERLANQAWNVREGRVRLVRTVLDAA